VKTCKKISILTVALTLGVLFNVANAFTDVSTQNQNTQAINYLAEKGIINGYPNDTFRPDNKINRAGFLKLIIASKTPQPTGQNCFTDVKTEWFAPYICYAKENKIVNGYSDNTFRPTLDINLAEALKISLGGNLEAKSGEAWYQPYLNIAEEKNYLKNINKDIAHKISRGETAQLIYNILNPPSSAGTPQLDDTPQSGENTSLAGLFDSEYPNLPPGKWDWSDTEKDGANYRNFETNIGTFEALKDSKGNQYGWKLVGNNPDAIDYGGAAAYFEGSPGTDILNLGKNGTIHSFGEGNLGDGKDVLVFDKSYSLDFRTGSSLSGSKNDDDLVIAGCQANTDASFDIATTTIHTGPGNDLVFVRDMERSAIDAGNGKNGDTSAIDPTDGNDTVIYRGNMLDFRFFGGNGNDTAVWYPDEVKQNSKTLGPDFFGGGGSSEAIWGDKGIDTLVLAIPPDTKITNTTPTQPGELLVRIPQDYPNDILWDNPVYNDIFARYCYSCGISPSNKKTLTLEYVKKDGTVKTGYFTVTDFERLQLWIGSNAKVYDLDSVNGKATLNSDLPKYTPPEMPGGYCS
jgi:hypothetical protein